MKYLRIEFENNRIPIYRTTITEEDENIDTPEKIQEQLKQIAENLGYTYIESSSTRLGRGTISIRNDVDIIIKYGTRITSMMVALGSPANGRYEPPMYNCTSNSADIDDVSVALQTCSMVCSEIRQKLM